MDVYDHTDCVLYIVQWIYICWQIEHLYDIHCMTYDIKDLIEDLIQNINRVIPEGDDLAYTGM